MARAVNSLGGKKANQRFRVSGNYTGMIPHCRFRVVPASASGAWRENNDLLLVVPCPKLERTALSIIIDFQHAQHDGVGREQE